MTINDQTNNLFATIGAAQTLVENFPMSIFEVFRGKVYTSKLDFLLDILNALGITPRDIADRVIEKLFDVPDSTNLYKNIANAEIGDSQLLSQIEDAIKILIADTLTAIASCNINPILPNYILDGEGSDGLSIPESLFDFQGLLAIQPTSEIGGCYYNTKDYYAPENRADKTLETNSLYKSHDLNAFIWYCLNRGTEGTTVEKNMMMWDNRRNQYASFKEIRDDSAEWGQWLTDLNVPSDLNNKKLFPIMQLSVDRTGTSDTSRHSDRRLKVRISSKTYTRGNNTANPFFNNRTIYAFNNDYLRSIRILEPKVVLTSILNSLLEGTISIVANAQIGINKNYIHGIISKAIKQMVESDDYEVNDCYYKFTNKDWDEMLMETELQRYGAKMVNGEIVKSAKISREDVINSINEAFSAEKQDRSDMIKSIFYDVSATASTIGEMSYDPSFKYGLGVGNEWLSNLLLQMATPIVNAVLSPQVMLLYYINLRVMGIVTSNTPFSDVNMNTIISFIINKLISVIIGIIRTIMDFILSILLDLYKEAVEPLIAKMKAWKELEALNNWITLLSEAISCWPRFARPLSFIDDVNYADIIPEQNIPESDTGKCDV